MGCLTCGDHKYIVTCSDPTCCGGAKDPCPDCAGLPLSDLGLVRVEPGRTVRKTRPLAVSRAPRASLVRVKALTSAILLDADGEAFARNDYTLYRMTHRAIESAVTGPEAA